MEEHVAPPAAPGSGPQRRWRSAPRFVIGAALLLLVLYAVLVKGAPWYGCFFVFFPLLALVVGFRQRSVRVGVTRSADEIVCRYLPAYERAMYGQVIILPGLGISALGMGLANSEPVALGLGIFLLALTAAVLVMSALMWRRGFLRITASRLALRGVHRAVTDIPRTQVQAIDLKQVYARAIYLQIRLGYRIAGTGDVKTVRLLGPSSHVQVSVAPTSLFNGLTAWRDGADDDPDELLDRIERLLSENPAPA